MTVAVLLVAVGLSFPFSGLRPGDERPWVDWGFIIVCFMLLPKRLCSFMVSIYSDRSIVARWIQIKNNKEHPMSSIAEK